MSWNLKYTQNCICNSSQLPSGGHQCKEEAEIQEENGKPIPSLPCFTSTQAAYTCVNICEIAKHT
ncbi:hypothetical protein I79_023293 [Cricetulus griseus]|uniref:Uncharacterized protein n=1 Tax=Cricetulus griseus TaxID=10029 RepID=G3IHK2_CRIGR|nr:hypothetical protein I79_023293 [Cricetulus griseus]